MKVLSLSQSMVFIMMSSWFAQAGEVGPLAVAETNNTTAQPVKNGKHDLKNIDILGSSDLGAMYIFAPGMEEVESMLLTRDFSRDGYFMQNIDREEFEMKIALREVTDEDDEAKLKLKELVP